MENCIAPSAKIGKGVNFGKGVIVEDNVEIGEGTTIGSYVVIHDGTKIGSRVRIDDNVVIGKLPMRAAFSTLKVTDTLPPASIGDDCLVGCFTVIYRGAVVGKKVLIADLASVREDVTIGEGTIVGRGVAIENKTTIGNYVKLETGSYITAFSTVEDRVFIAPMVTTTNDNFMGRTEERFKHTRGATVKKGGRIAANSTLLPGIVIGEDAVVAAGSVVTKNVPASKIVKGAPAKVWRDTPKEQLLENQ